MKKFCLALALLAVAVPSHAVVVDFTVSDSWSTGVMVAPGLYVKVSSTGGALTTQTFDGVTAHCLGILQCASDGVDGLGVAPPDDEVTFGSESLEVTFWADSSGTTAVDVLIEEIFFLDLFAGVPGATDPETEVAQWWYLDSGGGAFGGDSLGGVRTNAELTGFAQTGDLGVTAHGIHFYANGGLSPANTDFAVAGIEVSAAPVPEPATMTLLGLGLLGIASRRRRLR